MLSLPARWHELTFPSLTFPTPLPPALSLPCSAFCPGLGLAGHLLGPSPGFVHCCPALSRCPGLLLAMDFLYQGFSESRTDSQQRFPDTHLQPGCPAESSRGAGPEQAEPHPNPGAPGTRTTTAGKCLLLEASLQNLPGTPRRVPTH